MVDVGVSIAICVSIHPLFFAVRTCGSRQPLTQRPPKSSQRPFLRRRIRLRCRQLLGIGFLILASFLLVFVLSVLVISFCLLPGVVLLSPSSPLSMICSPSAHLSTKSNPNKPSVNPIQRNSPHLYQHTPTRHMIRRWTIRRKPHRRRTSLDHRWRILGRRRYPSIRTRPPDTSTAQRQRQRASAARGGKRSFPPKQPKYPP